MLKQAKIETREVLEDKKTKEILILFHSGSGSTRIVSRVFREKVEGDTMKGAKGNDIDSYLEAFECLEDQKGILVFIDGEVVGFDFLSLNGAFNVIFGKLVKSYAIEAALKGEAGKKKAETSIQTVNP